MGGWFGCGCWRRFSLTIAVRKDIGMNKLKEAHVPYNTGWAGDLKKGQVIRITATTTVDFVCMRRENLKERFDQARTKVYNMKIFLTTGDKLMGRNNQHMMTIVENTNREGTHDLQKGMCSGYRFQLAKKDRKSTRLNSSHLVISYAVFC